jgi:hypothetical protein
MEQEDMDSFRREHNRHDTEHLAKAARAKSRQRLAATVTANRRCRTGTKFKVPKGAPSRGYLHAGSEKRGHLAAPGRQTKRGGYREGEGPLASDIGSFSHGQAVQTLGAQDFIA